MSSNDDKKLKFSTAKIRALTLLFENTELEDRWNVSHKRRLKALSTRYLFLSGLFQGLFLWSDQIEGRSDPALQEVLWLHAIIRLALGGGPLIFCFLYAVGIFEPSQFVVLLTNLLYGMPTLALHILSRRTHCHWDSLFLIYGLAFFMLPKLSPLNFIFGVSGASLLSLMYVYLSAFRLSLEEWMLSNLLLGIIFVLMTYLTYSSEKASRERWLLKERLQKEKISVKLVASSIQDDLRRAANEERQRTTQRMAEIGNFKNEVKSVASNLTGFMRRSAGKPSSTGTSDNTSTGADGVYEEVDSSAKTGSDTALLKKNLTLFFKGLLAWGMIVLLSYTFDYVSRKHDVLQDSEEDKSEANTSAAFALLMHTSGFSVFLLYFTGQIRWLLINGLVGLTLMWVLNLTGMEQKWVVFGTHTAGYVILVIVIVSMILVFGGVVLVWTNLIDFLKDILNRYPQVKSELSENKLLEQVIVTYISQLPPNAHTHGAREASMESGGREISLQVLRGGADVESSSSSVIHSSSSHAFNSNSSLNSSNSSGSSSKKSKKGRKVDSGGGGGRERSSSAQELSLPLTGGISEMDIIHTSTGKDLCYFCLKGDSKLCYVPACSAWRSPGLSADGLMGYPTCTSYATMSVEKNEALAVSKQATADWLHLSEVARQLQTEKDNDRRASESSIKQLQKSSAELSAKLTAAKVEAEKAAEAAKKDGAQAMQEAQRAHRVFIEEQRASHERDLEALRADITRHQHKLNEAMARIEAQEKQLSKQDEVLKARRPQQQQQEKKERRQSQDAADGGGTLNKHGVDISNRNARRNANNPNNPNYNPRLKKALINSGSGSGSGSSSGSGQKKESKDIVDKEGLRADYLDWSLLPEPRDTREYQELPKEAGLGSDSGHSSGSGMNFSLFEFNPAEPNPSVGAIAKAPGEALPILGDDLGPGVGSPAVPVYTGSLNLRGLPGTNLGPPAMERLTSNDVVTGVLHSLALDDGDSPAWDERTTL